jgi:hypothetical protein
MPIKSAMMPMTTSISVSEKPLGRRTDTAREERGAWLESEWFRSREFRSMVGS